MYIYKITSPANKHYIGQTQRSTDLRLQEHISAWKRWSKDKSIYGTVKLFYAFDQHPPETWQFEVLKECSSFEELNKTEEYYIQFYDSVQNGYNITYGGDGRKVDCLDDSHKENLSIARKEYFETNEGKKWKKVLSEKFSGENNPMYGKGKQVSEQNSKWYLLLDPDDNELIIKNIFQFRKDNPDKSIELFNNKLLNNTVSKYCKYKDYRAILLPKYSDKLNEEEKRNIIDLAKSKLKPMKKWEVIDPDGNVYIIMNLTKFAKQYKLLPQCLSNVALGKSYSHKGWKIKLIL